ncbi:YggS family pyridoxal phosphate-dependent enzyme [Rhodococcus sp. IEGM 69]|uniref:YggS family pyridoxal phosphate-dependent enzyme n=1 Tax=Rhodococcus sp. IEGM 69 TaxID=3082229 RepID=UPI002955C017|nr:YggS family pyridoxal phosphate-dependent enzyme [Rhodococcus sp. IEGM 69]MDV8106216.1 YggS family pyridoxal phosphate-dependent enzyme [Rhodococcus sp. IEGM 69]
MDRVPEVSGAGDRVPEASGAGDRVPEASGAGDRVPEASGAGDRVPEASDRVAQISGALGAVRERLDAACRAAGREPSEVTLLPVTKFFPESDARILYELGCREFGESREQEATAKIGEFRARVPDPAVRWHMIGHLQRNKARAIAQWAYAIHSVDSERLVGALGKAATAAVEAGERTEPLRVLLQVSLDGDPQRGGAVVGDLENLAAQVRSAPHLEFRGLMAVPPIEADPDAAFEELHNIHARLCLEHPDATELSAGMTNDLEHAVRHGSTCVRVGTALLGARPITSK